MRKVSSMGEYEREQEGEQRGRKQPHSTSTPVLDCNEPSLAGSPRVGSAQWAKLLATPTNTHILRVVAGDDVVSLVPTSVRAHPSNGLVDGVRWIGGRVGLGDPCRASTDGARACIQRQSPRG